MLSERISYTTSLYLTDGVNGHIEYGASLNVKKEENEVSLRSDLYSQGQISRAMAQRDQTLQQLIHQAHGFG